MRCKRTLADNSTAITNVYWKLFNANCPKINQLCSGKSKAFVPAITVCVQSLHTGSCDSTAKLC